MTEKRVLPVNSTVMIWGESDISVGTAGEISDRQPVLFACPNSSVHASDKFKLLKNAKLQAIKGANGNFMVSVDADGIESSYQVGAVFVFPQAVDDAVSGLDKYILAEPSTIVVIIKDSDPQTFAIVLNKILQGARAGHRIFMIVDELQVTARDSEDLWQEAREAGVIIFKDVEPAVTVYESGYTVEMKTDSLGVPEIMVIEADQVVTVGESVLKPSYLSLLKMLGVESHTSQDRYPFRTSREGIFVIEPTWGEPLEEEDLAKMVGLLAGQYAGVGIEKAVKYRIEPDDCALCLTCYRVCPHQAVRFGQKSGNIYGEAMDIDPLACQGCGACLAECPAQAVKTIAEVTSGLAMILACENSGGILLQNSGLSYQLYPCAGSISTNNMLEALASGVDEVYVLTCRDGKCQHEYGGTRLSKRVGRLNQMLARAGIKRSVRVLRVSAQDKATDIMKKVGERP